MLLSCGDCECCAQIVMLRNPADRMYSAFYYYGHYGTRYGSHPEGFHTYAQAMVDNYNKCVEEPGMSNRCVGVQLRTGAGRFRISQVRDGWRCSSRGCDLD
jgi:hypothetical protein